MVRFRLYSKILHLVNLTALCLTALCLGRIIQSSRSAALPCLRLVPRIARSVCRVPVAARLALSSQIVDPDLPGLQAVKEGLEVGQAYGEDSEALH
jgi:hypothetical protein